MIGKLLIQAFYVLFFFPAHVSSVDPGTGCMVRGEREPLLFTGPLVISRGLSTSVD